MKKLEVAKIGGKVIDDKAQLDSVLEAFSKMEGPKILIHGGGSKASEMEKTIGLIPNMVEGRRITDERSIEVVTMVYAGLINKKIVAGLQGFGCNAMGLSGADGNAILSQKRPVNKIDYGFVGDVDFVNGEFIESLLSSGLTPVFSAITHDGKGQLLNTNADTMASAIAQEMSKIYTVQLTLAFEKNGVLDANGKVISQINETSFSQLKQEKIIVDGMIPKLTNAFDAIKNGVANVRLSSAENLIHSNSICTKVVL